MPGAVLSCPTLADWIAAEGVPFSRDEPESLDAAVDGILAVLGESVEILGLGEPTHGAEVFLQFRNRVFQRLVERHGVTAIALESSFPRAPVVNEYVAGRGPASYDEIQDRGFSHGSARRTRIASWSSGCGATMPSRWTARSWRSTASTARPR